MTTFVTVMSILFLLIACAASALLGCYSKKLRQIVRNITIFGTDHRLWFVWVLLIICLLGNVLAIGTIPTL